MFCACLDQVQLTPAGTVVGVPHSAIDFAFRMRRVPPERESETFDKVKALSQLYAEEVNKRVAAANDTQPKGANRSRH